METKEQRIDLGQLLKRIWLVFTRLWVVVLVLTVLGGSLFFVRAKNSYVPLYEAKAYFSVESGYSADSQFGTNTYFDQYAAEQLAKAFSQILNTDVMRDQVLQRLPGGINGTATARSVADTRMMSVVVTSTDPDAAYAYLEAIIDSYPMVAVYMVDYPQLEI